jgi:hypothetical protein
MRAGEFRRPSIKHVLSAAACFGALAMAGCEAVNEGVTDYRKADIGRESMMGAPTEVNNKYRLSNDAAASDVPIKAHDTFYVSLLQAFVGPDARFGGFPNFEHRQEMLVVLRARDSNSPDSPGEFAFYSDDVVRGQFLNFSNMLTLGPAFYQGGVITIDVDEIRLAGTTEHIKETLKQLADSKMDVVGPDPEKRRNWNAVARDIFDVIDRDAYGTRYTLTLMPSGGVAELPYPRFEAGNYVLMRHEAPDTNFSWDTLQLDNNTGRLIFKGGGGRNYDQSSYVTVQINALRSMPENPMPEVRKPLQRTPKPVDAPKYQSLDQARECPLSPDVQAPPGCRRPAQDSR